MPVYLDHNATTPLDAEVLEAMMPYMTGLYGNPSSVHRYGRLTRDALEQARVQVAQLIGAQPSEVIFTSGGTEANNLAIKGGLASSNPRHFAISAIEHASIVAPARQMVEQGWQLSLLPVNAQGVVDTQATRAVLSESTKMLSVMAANNETGVLQDIPALVHAVKQNKDDVIFHSDACQMVGKLPIDFAASKLDLMSLSSHKIYGPLGAGALVAKSHIDLAPIIVGGGQERQRRSGTENLPALVGFGAAAELAAKKLAQRKAHVLSLQTMLIEQLNVMQGISLFSQNVPGLPNTTMFALSGVDGEMLLMQLDKKGFAVSSGSACDSGRTDPSHVLIAMDIKPKMAKGAIRVSFGEQNSVDEVQRFISALNEINQQFN